jgi:hypothetical protein
MRSENSYFYKLSGRFWKDGLDLNLAVIHLDILYSLCSDEFRKSCFKPAEFWWLFPVS